MKIRVVFFSVLLAAVAHAAPRAQILSVSESGDRLVVNYSLAEAAIVVADIQTNVSQDVYASVGGEHQWTLDGDVNKSGAAGSRSLTWTPSSDLPDCDIDPAKIKVVLTTYPAGDAPDYMVVDLSTAKVDRVTYYPGAAWLPGGISNGDYLSNKIVMRHIRAKGESYRMGSLGEAGRSSNEYAHTVTLTNDFWIGVFEATYAQMFRFGLSTASALPVRNSPYNHIRGSTSTCDWPIKPAASSYIGRLRADTGLPFDLPSEAQWEFACRAGYGEGMLGDGSPIVSRVDGSDVYNVKYMACYGKAWSSTDCSVRGGSYKPNAWGLYDMYGNEDEFCVDWYKADISANAFGEVVTSGTAKVTRGGCFTTGAAACRSALRGSYAPDVYKHEPGFRLYSPYGFQDEALVDAE